MKARDDSNAKIIRRLMLRLLPIQVLMLVVANANTLVSSYFASNYVGVDAMSAVGLYAPVSMLLSALSTMLTGGSAILCGKYAGKNERGRLQNIFSLDLAISALISFVIIAVLLILGTFDLTGFFTSDKAVRPLFDYYLLGSAIGIFPYLIGSQLPAYLAMENKNSNTTIASTAFVVSNVAFNYIFVCRMHMQAFGLALSASLGLWVFMIILAAPFISGHSQMKLSFRGTDPGDSLAMIKIGFPGAASYIFQTIRGLIVNKLLIIYVGSIGVSAFAAANNLMMLFWAVPGGMVAVSRLMLSVSIGEEDRQSLADIVRVVFKIYIPIQCALSLVIMLCAVPFAGIFFKDAAEPVFMMTAWGFRLLPVCMPFGIICMHAMCYGQIMERNVFVNILAFVDGVLCVAGFTAILIPSVGMNSVYLANILNGFVTAAYPLVWSIIKNKHFPRDLDELLVLPEGFGAPPDERLDLTIKSMDEVSSVSERIQAFCLERGIDKRRAYLSGLAMEEMAGNVVEHGFVKDKKSHTVDVRVVHKDSDMILRIRDDCVPFDPGTRSSITENEDITKNIGIRMVFRMATDVQYQNILGLNVLTIRI